MEVAVEMFGCAVKGVGCLIVLAIIGIVAVAIIGPIVQKKGEPPQAPAAPIVQ